MTEMRVHQIAELAPPMSADEYQDLAADVARNGLIAPIVTWHGELVDGRHRLRACDAAGVEPRFDALPDDWDAGRVLLHVLSLHKRRNLSASQRALYGAEADALWDVLGGAAKERQRAAGEGRAAKPREGGRFATSLPSREGKLVAPAPARHTREASAQVAAAVGASRASVERAAVVVRAAGAGNAVAADAAARIAAGTLKVAQAERIMRAPAEHQAAMLAQLDTADRSADAGDSWGTPPEWIAFARTVMGGIDLDPASNDEAQRTVQAAAYYTAKDDGLAQEWPGRVWMNPPYSQPLVQRFAEKLLVEIDAGRCTQAVVLVNNVTDTRTGQTLLGACNAVLFPRGRVPFVAPGGAALTGARQGQMVLYFGPRAKAFAAAGRGLGWVGVAL